MRVKPILELVDKAQPTHPAQLVSVDESIFQITRPDWPHVLIDRKPAGGDREPFDMSDQFSRCKRGYIRWLTMSGHPNMMEVIERRLWFFVTVDQVDDSLADMLAQDMLLTLIPNNLLQDSELTTFLEESQRVLFHPEPGTNPLDLLEDMSYGFSGCVNFKPPLSPGAEQEQNMIFILMYTSDYEPFLGIIPKNKKGFKKRLLQVLQQHKVSYDQQQENNHENSLDTHISGGLISEHSAELSMTFHLLNTVTQKTDNVCSFTHEELQVFSFMSLQGVMSLQPIDNTPRALEVSSADVPGIQDQTSQSTPKPSPYLFANRKRLRRLAKKRIARLLQDQNIMKMNAVPTNAPYYIQSDIDSSGSSNSKKYSSTVSRSDAEKSSLGIAHAFRSLYSREYDSRSSTNSDSRKLSSNSRSSTNSDSRKLSSNSRSSTNSDSRKLSSNSRSSKNSDSRKLSSNSSGKSDSQRDRNKSSRKSDTRKKQSGYISENCTSNHVRTAKQNVPLPPGEQDLRIKSPAAIDQYLRNQLLSVTDHDLRILSIGGSDIHGHRVLLAGSNLESESVVPLAESDWDQEFGVPVRSDLNGNIHTQTYRDFEYL